MFQTRHQPLTPNLSLSRLNLDGDKMGNDAMTTSITNLRIGDADRERTAAQLGLALSQGYLQFPEYEARMTQAFAVTTATELESLIGDLPIAVRRHDPQRLAAQARAAKLSVRIHVAAYLVMVVIVLTVWAATAIFAGATYFWPIWPILGAGIGLISHATPVGIALRRSALCVGGPR